MNGMCLIEKCIFVLLKQNSIDFPAKHAYNKNRRGAIIDGASVDTNRGLTPGTHKPPSASRRFISLFRE